MILSIVGFFKKLKERIVQIKLNRYKRQGIYYINGAEVLPPPLEKEEENDIICRLGEDEYARQKLVEHNLRLVVYIAKRFENTGKVVLKIK